MPDRIRELEAENARLRAWVDDLQSGMFINCVYCGHRYGPRSSTPVSMSEVLTAHIEGCPRHPLTEVRSKLVAVCDALKALIISVGCDGDDDEPCGVCAACLGEAALKKAEGRP